MVKRINVAVYMLISSFPDDAHVEDNSNNISPRLLEQCEIFQKHFPRIHPN